MGRSIVRLKDIADKTGFSTNTVSLALRQSPRIPQQTRDIIQRAASELNYLPNQIAKSLVSRETKTIGLVLTDINNPVLTHTAQAIELIGEDQFCRRCEPSARSLHPAVRSSHSLEAQPQDCSTVPGRKHSPFQVALREAQGARACQACSGSALQSCLARLPGTPGRARGVPIEASRHGRCLILRTTRFAA